MNEVYRIRELRNERRMSGVEVAEKLKISPQYYYDIEKGKKNLSADNAMQLAELFKVSVDHLLGKESVVAKQPYYSLNEKDERDIAKDLERIMNNLDSNHALAFYGEEAEFDEDAKEMLRIQLEQTMRMAKQMAKKKFTPNKFRNE